MQENVLNRIQKAASIEGNTKFLQIRPGWRINNNYLFLVVLGLSLWLFCTYVNVFMDDVFFYFRVARNIADGTGPVLNPGDNHFPVTSPLWVFLLAFLQKVFGFMDWLMPGKMIFTLCLALASYLGFLCLREYIGSWAVLIPLPIFFNFITVTMVGGEIALVYLSLFGILWAYYFKKNFLLTGFWAGVAYLARGELVLILVPIFLHYLFTWKKEKKSFRALIADMGKLTMVFLAIISIWHLYYALQFHTLFPNTLKTKTVQGKSGIWRLYYQMGRPHALDILGAKYYLVFFTLFGLVYFRALSFTLLGFTILHYYAYKFLTVAYYHWYFYDYYLIIPVFTLFGMIAFFIFLAKFLRLSSLGSGSRKFVQSLKILKPAGVLLLLGAAVFCVFRTTRLETLPTYNYQKDDRFQRYIRVADWIKKTMKKGDVLLGPEIGIIGYYLHDAVIRDLNGIASPDVTVDNINKWEYFVGTYSPRFLFFPPCAHRQGPMEYFLINNNVYIYKRGFEEKVAENCKELVFLYSDRVPATAFLIR